MTLSRTKREKRAEQFEYDLIAEIYSDYEMYPLWVKYQDEIMLPVKNDERVIFLGNDLDPDYKKLKHFITDFEQKMFEYENNIHFTRISFAGQQNITY